jgi:formylglycine-generating enzyme required for sulfatase activity
VVIPAGEFLMGSEEHGSMDDKIVKGQGKRLMRIARGFALGRYPVTFDEYDVFLAATVSTRPRHRGEVEDFNWGRGRCPVINVALADAQAYCDWLNHMTGLQRDSCYRLPSEAEWEYACRAGTNTRRWWGEDWDPKKANGAFSFEDGRTSPVGHYSANPWGLHDMIGNVWERCADIYTQRISDLPQGGTPYKSPVDILKVNSMLMTDNILRSSRVQRGGAWNSSLQYLRSAARTGGRPSSRVNGVGFRVTRTLSTPAS